MRPLLERKLHGSTDFQNGFIGAALAIVLAVAGLLGLFYSAITTSTEYNNLHRIAQEVAADPDSHTNEEILNSGEALCNMMSQTVASAGGIPGGLGAQQLIIAEDALRKVRTQQYIIRISITPPDPAPFQTITVTIEILNSATGTLVTSSLVGTDGYTQANSLHTDAKGTVSFTVPGGRDGIVDSITVTAGSVTQTYSYTF